METDRLRFASCPVPCNRHRDDGPRQPIDLAVQAMRLGAYDFMTKPLDPEVLGALGRAACVCPGALLEEKLLLFCASQIHNRYSFRESHQPKSPRIPRHLRVVSECGPTTTTVADRGAPPAKTAREVSPRRSIKPSAECAPTPGRSRCVTAPLLAADAA